MMTNNQRTFMMMKMMKTVRITGAMSTQRRRTVMKMKIPEALTITAAAKKKETTADHQCGANTLWMCRRSLTMTAPMTSIQTDDAVITTRFYHKPLGDL